LECCENLVPTVAAALVSLFILYHFQPRRTDSLRHPAFLADGSVHCAALIREITPERTDEVISPWLCPFSGFSTKRFLIRRRRRRPLAALSRPWRASLRHCRSTKRFPEDQTELLQKMSVFFPKSLVPQRRVIDDLLRMICFGACLLLLPTPNRFYTHLCDILIYRAPLRIADAKSWRGDSSKERAAPWRGAKGTVIFRQTKCERMVQHQRSGMSFSMNSLIIGCKAVNLTGALADTERRTGSWSLDFTKVSRASASMRGQAIDAMEPRPAGIWRCDGMLF